MLCKSIVLNNVIHDFVSLWLIKTRTSTYERSFYYDIIHTLTVANCDSANQAHCEYTKLLTEADHQLYLWDYHLYLDCRIRAVNGVDISNQIQFQCILLRMITWWTSENIATNASLQDNAWMIKYLFHHLCWFILLKRESLKCLFHWTVID